MRPLGVKDFSPCFRTAVVEQFQTMTAGKVAKLFGLRSKQAVYDLVRSAKRKSTENVHKPVEIPVFHSKKRSKQRLTIGQDGNVGV